MTKQEAYDALPADSVWSCSFGYPGTRNFYDYFRAANGCRYVISNGDSEYFPEWKCERIN